MKLAYIAGAYRADTKREVYANIRAAALAGVEVARKGYAVIIPHCNSRFAEILGNLGDQYWLDMDIEVLSRCDLLVLVPGWENSVGTIGEVAFARADQIPVYELSEVPEAQV